MTHTPTSLLRQVYDRPVTSIQAGAAQLNAARKAMVDLTHPYIAHMEGRAKDFRTTAFGRIDNAGGLVADLNKIAKAVSSEPLTGDLLDAYVGLTQEAKTLEAKLAADAGNGDHLAEILAAPLDAMDRMYEKFPVLGARRGSLI